MPAKKSKSKPDEQTELLHQILAELQKLNANLSSGRAPATHESVHDPDDGDSEELDEYE